MNSYILKKSGTLMRSWAHYTPGHTTQKALNESPQVERPPAHAAAHRGSASRRVPGGRRPWRDDGSCAAAATGTMPAAAATTATALTLLCKPWAAAGTATMITTAGMHNNERSRGGRHCNHCV